MKTKNQTPKEIVSTKTAKSVASKQTDPITQAKGLVAQLRRDGVHVFSNGSSSYLVMGKEVMELDFYDIDTIEAFLEEHNYLPADSEPSKTFWGAFLDAALDSDSILLQKRLWELGDKKACCDITRSASCSMKGAKETILEIMDRYGDKLIQRA